MNITCQDCGDVRKDVAYATTKFCERCRLLRDLNYIGDRDRSCGHCKAKYAPLARNDKYCGKHAFGGNVTGHCGICKKDDVELHRPAIKLCVACVRSREHRMTVVQALKKGQRERRAANNHAKENA